MVNCLDTRKNHNDCAILIVLIPPLMFSTTRRLNDVKTISHDSKRMLVVLRKIKKNYLKTKVKKEGFEK